MVPTMHTRQTRRLALSLPARQTYFITAAAFCLSPWASPALALALGMGLALALENPFSDVSKHAAKVLLQACVVALGFGMNLAVVLAAGKSGMLLASGSIAGTLILGISQAAFSRSAPKHPR